MLWQDFHFLNEKKIFVVNIYKSRHDIIFEVMNSDQWAKKYLKNQKVTKEWLDNKVRYYQDEILKDKSPHAGGWIDK